MASLSSPPSAERPQRWVVCNTLDEGRDPDPSVREWIRHCERCGTAVYVRPFYDDAQKVTQTFMVLPGASRLSAVKNHRVITLDFIYLLSRPAAGVQLLYNRLQALR